MAIIRRKSDLIWSYLAYILTLGINVILLPLILSVLSSDELGLWYTFASVSTMISLVDFGFSPTIIRNLTYAFSGAKTLKKEGVTNDTCESNPNLHLFTQVFICSKYLCMGMSIIALILLLTVGSGYIFYVSKEMGSQYLFCWIIYAVGCFMNLYFNYWTNSLKSVGAIGESQRAIVIAKISQFIVSAVGIALGGGLMALAIAYVISGIVQRMISRKEFIKRNDTYNKMKEYMKNLNKNDLISIFKIIWFNAKKAGVSTLMTSAMSQSGTIICSGILGVGKTGEYGLSLQLISILCSVGQIYFQTNIPMLTNARITNDKKRIIYLFSSSVMMFWFTTILGVFAICTIGLPILKFFGANTIPSIWMILGIAMYNLPESNYAIHATFITMGNKIPFVNSLFLTCITRIVLTLLLAMYSNLGVYSIIVASIISNYIYIVWKWPLYALKEINISIKSIIFNGTKNLLLDIKNMLFKNKLI